VEQVAVRSCRRRGAAIDLVLDRGRNNRSQIVFTRPNPGRPVGRPMIFWQTARTAQRARPGQRVPTRRASDLEQLTILVDTRERYPYKFAGRPVERRRVALPVGDYAIRHAEQLIAVVERKTPEDCAKSLVDGSLNYVLAELAALPAAAVVVEERYGALLDNRHAQPGWLLEIVARLQVRYTAVPIVFADSRKLARNTPTATSPPRSSTTPRTTPDSPTTSRHERRPDAGRSAHKRAAGHPSGRHSAIPRAPEIVSPKCRRNPSSARWSRSHCGQLRVPVRPPG
jgi:hypothetical protein